jgi:hypothetical protein
MTAGKHIEAQPRLLMRPTGLPWKSLCAASQVLRAM